ncbi:MAG TPA: hypothetical protein VIF84_10095 [Candidatus Limnocylindrales bacterium]|jgi:hypothetical protein
MDTERLAAIVAAIAVFAGLVMPLAVLGACLAVLSIGIAVRLLDVRVRSRREVQNLG